MTDDESKVVRMPTLADMDPEELANLLRNLAHGIEEGDVPVTAVETGTEVEGDEAMACELKLTYRPPNTLLIPGVRLGDALEDLE